MEVTLKEAVNMFCGNYKVFKVFKYYLLRLLKASETEDIVLREGETVEITFDLVTVCFTWEMISAVNNITHEYVDLLTPEKAFDVFD